MTEILHKKVEEVSYPLGDNDCYIDKSKDILKSIYNVWTDSDGEIKNMYCNFGENKGVSK